MDEYISKQRAKDLMGCCLVSAKANLKVETSIFKKAEFESIIKTIESMIDVVGAVEAADVQPVNQWISVEDKLPIEQGPVLCYARSTTGEGNCRILGTLRNGEFWFLQVDGTQLSFPCLHLKVTHWMPLPKPPKDGDTNA